MQTTRRHHTCRRLLFCVALGVLISATVSSSARAGDAAWASNRQHRILLEVKPNDNGNRARDERPAEVALDFEQLRSTGVLPEHADLSTLQVMRYDAATGLPIPYKNNVYGETPFDLPLQWYDAAIPDPFPERDSNLVIPTPKESRDPKPAPSVSAWNARPRWGYYYEVNGDWKKGRLAWTHIQVGNESSHYAVYFDTLKPGEVPSQPAPRGWTGDGAHRTAKLGTRSTGLLHGHAKLVDVDRDGLLDVICGSSRGGLVWYRNFGTPQAPRFTIAKLLFQSDGKAIDTGFYSYPAVIDWDRDGKLDLLVGANGGYVIFYRNVGADAAPVYEEKGVLEADGAVLNIPFAPVPEVQGPQGEPIYKNDYAPSPHVVDWDGDGALDLLLGGYVTGRVFWYQNTGLDEDGLPKLSSRGPLMAGAKPLDVGWCASPTVADLDGDQDLDLIVGNWRKPGNESPPEIVEDVLAYFENVGSRTHPILEMKPLPRIGAFPNDIPDPINWPSLADWDGDGVLDLLVSRFDMGQWYFFKNVGTAKQPKFDARHPKAFPLPWANDPLPFYAQNMHTYVDWNRDGWPDIVSGRSFFSDGAQQVHINTGEALPWRFKPPVPLLPAGATIDHRAWRGDDWAWQTLVDFDADGKTDILVGDFWGQVWFHKNTSGADTSYDTKGSLVTVPDGTPIRVGPGADSPWDFTTLQGSRVHVLASDFDGNGSIDLVLSDTNGRWYYCDRGRYGKQAMVESQVLIQKMGSRGNMTDADWDGDGKLDVLISLGTRYYWLRNIGAAGDATPFAQPEKLDLPLVPVLGTEVAIAVMEMNGDGDQDVILASGHNYHCFFERSFLQHGYAAGTVLRVESRKSNPSTEGARSR